MKKLMLSLLIAFGFSACSLNNDDIKTDCGPTEESAFTGTPLLCAYNVKAYPTVPTYILVNTDEKLQSFFTKREGASACPNAGDLTIDFTKNYLVGLFSGLKTTTGYGIKITGMVENKCEILVTYYEKAPQPGEPITSTVNYPSDFILIPKTSKPILFNKTNENPDNIVVGTYFNQCTGGTDCRKFYQLNDYNILKFQNVAANGFDFNQYKYTVASKKGDYTLFLKSVPTEILNLKGQTKTYGTPDAANQGGTYFELRQAGIVTKIFIDNNDTSDQSSEIKLFKKAIQDKVAAQK
ncbi:protease complex subunit PrcB family protein [Flavobacterium bizetiae]|uniref:protease complex subunit PrcB family protein n=1 Tax=Flavobacterium bizetiae TaxID=2704140 RepID=UPI0021E8F27C|nr:protease complex subunit PrcB family protein [Flavobacterium bizetiae]UTN04382.1 protease complex subunit PrcB family protein [Flavobacterium bizetiae]